MADEATFGFEFNRYLIPSRFDLRYQTSQWEEAVWRGDEQSHTWERRRHGRKDKGTHLNPILDEAQAR